MSTHFININPGDAAPPTSEPMESAVLEVSERMAALNSEKRRLFSRLDELRSGDSSLRRKHSRELPAQLQPVTFYSIEEVA
jgi:hypothetical protein